MHGLDYSASAYAPVVSLVPGGTLQFVDVVFNVTRIGRLRRNFWEYATEDRGADGVEQQTFLVCLDVDERTGDYIDRATGKVAIDPRTKNLPENQQQKIVPEYAFNAEKAFEVFLGEWVPLPMLRKQAELADGSPQFGRWPTNWARARVTALPAPDANGNTHRLTLAFDTTVEPAEDDAPAAALTEADVNDGASFALASHERDCGWFVNLDWVADWLDDMLANFQRERRRGRRAEDEPGNACEHIARYLAFIQMLDSLGVVPQARLVHPWKNPPVEVDLVLDIGNSRTCGILIETGGSKRTDLNDSYVLELRNLSHPERRYREPFGSSLEFSIARFGDPQQFSRGSGRRQDAFAWPSVVRVGPEASELLMHSRGTSGATGMSSPKRYLWDEAPRPQEWRFNTGSDDPFLTEDPVARGPFVEFVNNFGVPTERVNDRSLRGNPAYRGQTTDPVTVPAFSRSSMMMFMLSEVLAHALVTINAPAQRAERRNSDIPRRLRRVILTMPSAMTIAERKILMRWAEWAIETTWKALGWQDYLVKPALGSAARQREREWRLSPELRCDWDEASATQIVYLYQEIVQKLRGDSAYVFGAMGRVRGKDDRPSLRIATIDIGGGTSDAVITTYRSLGSGVAAVIQPNEEFREGFTIAGDHILRAVVETHFVREVYRAATAAGARDAKSVLTRLIGGDYGAQSERDRTMRNSFIRQVAVPVGLGILARCEQADLRRGNTVEAVSFEEFFTPATRPRPDVIAFVDDAMRQAGATQFSLASISIPLDAADIEDTVRTAIGGVLGNLAEAVHAYDCDVLLLSGRPSCLPAVRNILLGRLPLAPHRILALHEYHVGSWYPFRATTNLIRDPKTMAAVGAMLGALSEGHLDAFSFQSDRLKPRSTARFVGEMELSGQIRRDKVVFPELDLDSKEEIELEREIEFHAPISIGFRQLETERWTATPFYRLAFSSNAAVNNARGRLPYTVTLTFTRKADEEDEGARVARIGDIRDEGAFRISEIVAADGGPVHPHELELKLQTLREAAGYWLDTGILTVT